MKRFTHGILLGSLLAPGLAAQEQATTLAALAQRAEVVVVATVLAAGDPAPDRHRVEFRTTAVLQGAPAARFALEEPAGRCCGRALSALAPGDSHLLFLVRHDGDLEPLGGDRGVLPASRDVELHVRTLLATTDPAARARVLATALAHGDARIRGDAALALAAMPLGADRFVHDRALAAAQQQLAAPDTRLPALLDTALRSDPDDPASALVPIYLTANAAAVAALARTLARLPGRALGDAVAIAAPADETARVRALELLAGTPDAANLPLLDRMLQEAKSPREALAATEALLAHGRSATALRTTVPGPVVDLAERRRAGARAFRTLTPRSPR